MDERFGLLFEDQSIMVFPEGTEFETAAGEAAEHDLGDGDNTTKVIVIDMHIQRVVK